MTRLTRRELLRLASLAGTGLAASSLVPALVKALARAAAPPPTPKVALIAGKTEAATSPSPWP